MRVKFPFPSMKPFRARPKKTKPSELSYVHLRGDWSAQTKALLARMASMLIIIFALYFGGAHTVFNLQTSDILGVDFGVDLQLAAIGVINKIFDLLITTSLEDFAEVLVTLWMTSTSLEAGLPGKRSKKVYGARLDDLELKEEFTKPWKSLGAFGERWTSFGWKRAGWIRMILTLACSVCVLLSGLAINTVGIPKPRWLPDDWENQDIQTPLVQFQGGALDWGQFWSFGWGIVGSGDDSWHASDALITASTFTAFGSFRDEFSAESQGWRSFFKGTDDQNFATVDTRYSGSTCRGFAGQGKVSRMLFEHFQALNFPRATIATGWSGNLSVAWPSASVSCGPFLNTMAKPAESVFVDANFNPDHYPDRNFGIDIFPSDMTSGSPFNGASCKVSVDRVLFSTTTWIVDNTSGSVSPNNYGHGDSSIYTNSISVLPPMDVDKNITQRLAVQAAAVISRLENLLNTQTSAAQFFVLSSRNLRAYRPEYQNDIEGLAPVICWLTNYLLMIASWNMTISTEETTMSTGMRFQVIGSGPRELWEWAATAILGVLLIASLLGLLQWIVYRIAPGRYLKTKGMLIAANRSPSLRTLNTSLAQGDKEMAARKIGVRRSGTGTVEIVVDPADGRTLSLKDLYNWKEE